MIHIVGKAERRNFMEQQSGFLDRIFHLKENHTSVRTEIMAGITTFMTMAYILAVNPGIMSAAGMDKGALLTALPHSSAPFSWRSLPITPSPSLPAWG